MGGLIPGLSQVVSNYPLFLLHSGTEAFCGRCTAYRRLFSLLDSLGEHTLFMSWIHPFLPDHRRAVTFEIQRGLGTSKGFAIKQAHKTDDPDTSGFATDHHPSKERMARVMTKVRERCNGTSAYSSRSIRNKNWVLAASKTD